MDPSVPLAGRGRPRAVSVGVGLAVVVAAVAGCSGTDPQQVKVKRAPGAPAPTKGTAAAGGDKGSKATETTLPFSGDEAIAYLGENCASCHEKGKPYASFWSFEPGKLKPEVFSVDPMSYRAYQAVKLRADGVSKGPVPAMPPDDDSAATRAAAKRFTAWARANAPEVVLEAHANYPEANTGEGVKVVFNFKCEKPVTFRQYLRRVTNDAFDREPRQDELAWAGNSPDVPTTKELRERVASKFRTNLIWRNDFIDVTLRKYADKIASVQDIRASKEISASVADDIRQELYQLIVRKFETTSWKDILLSDTVMVSARTASLYSDDCPVPSAGEWKECRMTKPRGSFFTTLGYLLSKPTSFLEPNNNYGRAALMNFVITGELLSAATSGPRGNAGVRPLPSCLKTRDYRGTISGDAVAPYGSAKVPSFGNICQSCHISRNLAAGSILFRPFTGSGLIFNPVALITQDPDVAAAIRPEHVNQKETDGERTQVSIDFLRSLLVPEPGTEQACVPGEEGSAGTPLETVRDLAALLATDQKVAKGLARHVPRAFSNLSTTTLEIQERIGAAYAKEGGRLDAVVEAYFSSETYACEKRE